MKAIVVKWPGKVRLFSLVSSKLAECGWQCAKSVCPPPSLKFASKFFFQIRIYSLPNHLKEDFHALECFQKY